MPRTSGRKRLHPSVNPVLTFSVILFGWSTCSVIACANCSASQTKTTPSVPVKNSKTRKHQDADNAARRLETLTQLQTVEQKAKKLESSILKIKIIAKVADALWADDEQHARNLFVQALQAIDSISLDPQKDQRMRIANAYGGADPLDDLRSQILQTVAAHDFNFAKKLLETLKDANKEAGNQQSPMAKSLEEKEELLWDIAIAAAKSQPQRTMEFVRAQLRRDINETVGSALVAIRRVNQALSDQLFLEALMLARNNLTVPGQMESLAIYVLPSEDESFYQPQVVASALSGRVIRSYLDYVSEKLLAQLGTGPAAIAKSDAAAEEFTTLRSLLPIYDNLAPDKAILVRQRLTVLSETMGSAQADRLSPAEKDITELLRQAEGIIGSRKRDLRLMQVSMIAARQGDFEQAISAAERISELDERSIQVSLLYYQASAKAVDKGDVEGAYRLARKIDFLPQRIMAYHRVAKQFSAMNEKDRAQAILDEAWEFANGANNSPQKVRSLLTLTTAMKAYDPERSFVFLSSAVSAINATDFSTPAPANSSRVLQITLDMLEIDNVFSLLARLDSERAFHLAQLLTAPEASLLAQATVCHEVLIPTREAQTKIQPPL